MDPITDTESLSEAPYSFEREKETHDCNNCGKEFEGEFENMKLCGPCSDERAMAMLSDIEPPEGGWPRGSDMDRI